MGATGILLAIIGNLFLPRIAVLLGAEGAVLENAILYGRICLCGIPFLTLQYTLQGFLITAERPQVGFWITVAAGVTNMILDALFITVFHWGLAGAAQLRALLALSGSGLASAPMAGWLRET